MRKITLLLWAGIIASLLTTACSGELFPEPEEINAPETRGREINPDLPPLEPIPDDGKLPSIVGIGTFVHSYDLIKVTYLIRTSEMPKYPELAGFELYGVKYYGTEPTNWTTLDRVEIDMSLPIEFHANGGEYYDTNYRTNPYAYSARAYRIDSASGAKIYGPRTTVVHTPIVVGNPGGAGDDEGPTFPIRP